MSYGFIAKNANNETVIDDEYPSIVRISDRIQTTSQGLIPSLAENEFFAAEFAVGSTINARYTFPDGIRIFNGIETNPHGVKVGIVESLPAQTGYGTEVFSSSGDRIWQSNSELGFVTQVGTYFLPNPVPNDHWKYCFWASNTGICADPYYRGITFFEYNIPAETTHVVISASNVWSFSPPTSVGPAGVLFLIRESATYMYFAWKQIGVFNLTQLPYPMSVSFFTLAIP